VAAAHHQSRSCAKGYDPSARSLFHARPPDLRGETLYPLNQLKDIHPALYEHEKRKYMGREAVLEFRIPLLDVLWNDTLHLSPIHPRLLAAAWRFAGLWSPVWDREFFEMPISRIAGHRAVWFASEAFWVNNSPNENVPLSPPLTEFSSFDRDAYQQLTAPPTSYQEYLLHQKEMGRRPLQFPKIPHVLVAGPINISGLTTVWADPRPEPRG